MAAVEDEMDDRFKDVDIETLLSRVERRPLTFSRKKSVFSAPEFSQRLKGEETIDEGCDLTLSFKVNGTPRPTLRWFKDDEEVKDHARLTVEEGEDGKYTLTLHQVNKGDEAAYRCRAENSEGACSCCFFLSVKGKPKSPKRDGKKNTHKRTVSFPTMFSTIVEKVEEEETAGKEASKAPVSPLTPFYDSITLRGRLTWQEFLGDWAFVNGGHKARGGSTGSYTSTGSESENPRDPDDVVRIFADAESWEPDDVFLDSPASEGNPPLLPHLPAAPDVVLLLQAAQQRTQRVGTVPAHAHRAPEGAASRGKAGQALTPSVIGPQKDSKQASRPEGDKSGTSSSSSSPSSSSLSSLPVSSSSVAAASGREGGNGEASLSADAGGGATGQAVIKDKTKHSAAAAEKTSASSPPSSTSSSSASSPSVAKSASEESQKNSSSSVSQNKTSPSSSSCSSAESGNLQEASRAGSHKRSPHAPKTPVGPPGGFSLSTDTLAAKDGSARPVSVRGPLGALISGGGDAGKKTSSRGPDASRRPGPAATHTVVAKPCSSKPSSAAATVVSSPPSSQATPTVASSPTPSKASPPLQQGPALTLTPSASSSTAPVLLVTPDSLQKRGRAGQMCDCDDPHHHRVSDDSSSSCASSAGSSFTTVTTTTTTATTTTSLLPSGSLSPSLSPSPTSQSSLGLGLLEPEHDREEREPTPIPPDRLIVAHTPTGSSVLMPMYRGNIHPPVHPVPAHVAARKGQTQTPEKEKDKPQGLTETGEKEKQAAERGTADKAGEGQKVTGAGLCPGNARKENTVVVNNPPSSGRPKAQAVVSNPPSSGLPRRVVSMPASTGDVSLDAGGERKRETAKHQPILKKFPGTVREDSDTADRSREVDSNSNTRLTPQPSSEKVYVPFVRSPGESAFRRVTTEESQPASPASSTPADPLLETSNAAEALYFDPVHQELVHVKRINPAPEPSPARSRSSAMLEPSRGKWGTREPSRRSASPGGRQERAGAKPAEQPRTKSSSALYASISSDPERDLVYQYFRELAFVLCLLTFIGLLFKIRPHVFVGVVLGVHLALFFSRKYIFIRKPVAK